MHKEAQVACLMGGQENLKKNGFFSTLWKAGDSIILLLVYITIWNTRVKSLTVNSICQSVLMN